MYSDKKQRTMSVQLYTLHFVLTMTLCCVASLVIVVFQWCSCLHELAGVHKEGRFTSFDQSTRLLTCGKFCTHVTSLGGPLADIV